MWAGVLTPFLFACFTLMSGWEDFETARQQTNVLETSCVVAAVAEDDEFLVISLVLLDKQKRAAQNSFNEHVHARVPRLATGYGVRRVPVLYGEASAYATTGPNMAGGQYFEHENSAILDLCEILSKAGVESIDALTQKIVL
jgi:hypothetical protein